MKWLINRSEFESMRLDTEYDGGFKFVFHWLSAEVLVEGTGSPSESVLLILKVVLFHVLYQAGSHMLVVVARAQTWEQLRAHLLV